MCFILFFYILDLISREYKNFQRFSVNISLLLSDDQNPSIINIYIKYYRNYNSTYRFNIIYSYLSLLNLC